MFKDPTAEWIDQELMGDPLAQQTTPVVTRALAAMRYANVTYGELEATNAFMDAMLQEYGAMTNWPPAVRAVAEDLRADINGRMDHIKQTIEPVSATLRALETMQNYFVQ